MKKIYNTFISSMYVCLCHRKSVMNKKTNVHHTNIFLAIIKILTKFYSISAKYRGYKSFNNITLPRFTPPILVKRC